MKEEFSLNEETDRLAAQLRSFGEPEATAYAQSIEDEHTQSSEQGENEE